MEIDEQRYPFYSLFQQHIQNLSEPDLSGWASGDCPYCGDPDTFRVNLRTGKWVCLPNSETRPELEA